MSFPAYDPSAWSDLFVASAGASAALTGLVFVAVLINLRAILKHAGLPERALETLILLLGVLTASIVVLIPDQGTTALGIELGLQSMVCLVVISKLIKRSPQEKRSWTVNRAALAAFGTVPFLLGSISLLAHRGGGTRLDRRRRHRRTDRRSAQRLGVVDRDTSLNLGGG